MSGFDFIPFDKEAGFALLETMRSMASAHRATVAQIAVAWLLQKPGVSTILLGASKLHQLEDNMGAVQVKLTPDEMKVLDEQSPHAAYYPNWYAAALQDTAVEKALGPSSR